MRTRTIAKTLLYLSLILLCARPMWPQATTSLRGQVMDSSGASIAGANVELVLTATGTLRNGVTNASGEYLFAQILPGTYTLTVSSPGFATTTKTGIQLLVSQPATVNVSMSVAKVATQVTVSAGISALLNTTDATLGNAFSALQIENLPSEARNVPDLLSLQPGVTFLGRIDSNSGTTAPGNTVTDSRSGTVNGARSDQSNITLDGIEVNDINNGFAFTSVLRVSQDAISTFRVTTANPNPNEGRSAGAQVALVTKSGTNNLHGVVYEYNRNSLLHANDFFNKQTQLVEGLPNKPLKLIRNVFGGSVGGPIKKNTAFFFANYEGRRDDQGFSSNGTTVPTQSFRNGILIYPCGQAKPGCTNVSTTYPNGLYSLSASDLQKMDPQGIGESAAILSILNSYPQPNNFTVGDGLNTAGYNFAYNVKRSYNAYTTRLDWNVTPDGKNTLFWRGNLQDDHEPSGPTFPGQPASTTVVTTNKGFAAGYTRVLSDNTVNNLAFGLTRQGYSDSGLLRGPYVSLISVSDLTAHSSTDSVVAPVYNLVDNLAWTKHSHNLSFGINFRFIDDHRSSNANSYSNAIGQFQYLSGGAIAGTGGPFDPAAYGFPAVDSSYKSPYNDNLLTATGILTLGTVTYNNTKSGSALPVGAPVVRDYRWNEYDAYAEDSWKVTPNTTLTYGLHYSYQQVPADTGGNQVGVCLAMGTSCAPGSFSLTQWLNTRASLAAAGQSASGAGLLGFPLNGRYNGKPDYWTPDKFDIAPRVAIAFSPTPESGIWKQIFGNGKSSIRAGYDLLYDHFGAAIANTFDTAGSYGLSTTLTTNAGSVNIATAPRFTSLNQVPQSLLPPPPPVTFPNIPGASPGAIYWSEDSALKTPYSHMVNVSVTRQIGDKASLQVAYVGRFSRRLLEQDDVAMPTNLSTGGTTYFQAARQMSQMARDNVPVGAVQPIAYWESLFGALDGVDIGYGPGLTATQNIYELYQSNLYNETNALITLDTPGSINPNLYPSYRFYNPQFSSLYAWRSMGTSNFNALEVVYQHRFGLGLLADFNYTYSKSLDETSQATRVGTSGGNNFAQVLNTWAPNQLYGPSDYDVRHQINANYVWDLPFGRGKRYGSNMDRLADELIGGWQTTGVVRWTSGFPFELGNGANYPTNWDINGFATQISKFPTKRGKLQQRFADPAAVLAAFEQTFPGDSGTRNPFRGDGYFEEDAGVGKAFSLVRHTQLRVGVEVFNVTNSVRFDAKSISQAIDRPTNFGNAHSLLTNPRLAQFYGRFEF